MGCYYRNKPCYKEYSINIKLYLILQALWCNCNEGHEQCGSVLMTTFPISLCVISAAPARRPRGFPSALRRLGLNRKRSDLPGVGAEEAVVGD